MNVMAVTGNMVADPITKNLATGNTVCVFSVADNDGSKASDHVTYFDCEAWAKTAEIISQYIRKGDQVSLHGRMRQEHWKDEATGKNMSKMKLVVQNVTLPRRPSRDDIDPRKEFDQQSQVSLGAAPF